MLTSLTQPAYATEVRRFFFLGVRVEEEGGGRWWSPPRASSVSPAPVAPGRPPTSNTVPRPGSPPPPTDFEYRASPVSPAPDPPPPTDFEYRALSAV